jgi:hypothetical protein
MKPTNVDSNASLSILWKGCLGGLALVGLFLGVSGIAYLLMVMINAPRNVLLLVSIASGPLVGTVLLILFAFWLASRQKPGPRAKRIYADDDD